MQHGSTLFLKSVTILFGIAVLALCIFVLPAGLRNDRVGMYHPILLGMYVPAIPFFLGLYQTLKLLHYIDTNHAFSENSIKALRIITYCGSIIGILYALGLPYMWFVAQKDDAPGVVLIGLIFTFAPLGISIISSVLQKLLQDALNLKLENELTV